MDKRAQIASILSELTKRGGQAFFQAQVVSVQGDTCTIRYDDLVISDVRLTPTTTERKETVLLTPATDSYVMVASLSGDLNNLCVLSADSIASGQITIGDISVFFSKDGIVLNDGELGGLVKVGDLVSKLNTIENQLNQLKNIFKVWVPVPMDGGAALKGAISTWAGQPVTTTKRADLENEKVKQ